MWLALGLVNVWVAPKLALQCVEDGVWLRVVGLRTVSLKGEHRWIGSNTTGRRDRLSVLIQGRHWWLCLLDVGRRGLQTTQNAFQQSLVPLRWVVQLGQKVYLALIHGSADPSSCIVASLWSHVLPPLGRSWSWSWSWSGWWMSWALLVPFLFLHIVVPRTFANASAWHVCDITSVS